MLLLPGAVPPTNVPCCVLAARLSSVCILGGPVNQRANEHVTQAQPIRFSPEILMQVLFSNKYRRIDPTAEQLCSLCQDLKRLGNLIHEPYNIVFILAQFSMFLILTGHWKKQWTLSKVTNRGVRVEIK